LLEISEPLKIPLGKIGMYNNASAFNLHFYPYIVYKEENTGLVQIVSQKIVNNWSSKI